MFSCAGKASRRVRTMTSRVKKEPSRKMKRGPCWARRADTKCDNADTGQRFDWRANRWTDAPWPNWSVLETGRCNVACERSCANVRCERRRVDGSIVESEGHVYSEERRRPKKAEVQAAQSMRASCGEYLAAKKARRVHMCWMEIGSRRGLVSRNP